MPRPEPLDGRPGHLRLREETKGVLQGDPRLREPGPGLGQGDPRLRLWEPDPGLLQGDPRLKEPDLGLVGGPLHRGARLREPLPDFVDPLLVSLPLILCGSALSSRMLRLATVSLTHPSPGILPEEHCVHATRIVFYGTLYLLSLG